MADSVARRAVLISAPASGQGKTTITAALARHLADHGARVGVFKTGPDFLDPMILAQASRRPVYQLDLFMGGEGHCRDLLYRAARECDVILVEGVMGLFDGQPSSADLARSFGLPVMAVIDASAMAGTYGAIAHGLATYQPGLAVIGTIANRVGGPRHAAMLSAEGAPPLLAALPRKAEIALPERHLGLLQALEIDDLDRKIAAAAQAIGDSWHADLPLVTFEGDKGRRLPQMLSGCRIAIARDAAFAFLYTANLDLLQEMGAHLTFFSPLRDDDLPPCEAVYLPGGYPELHLERLSHNTGLKAAIHTHYAAGKPIVAECGGLLFLLESLAAAAGRPAAMVGLLAGQARLQPRLAALALQSVALPEGTLRGHTFHYSKAEIAETPLACGVCPNGSATSERVYRKGRLTASYIHFYFPSNPEAAAGLFLP